MSADSDLREHVQILFGPGFRVSQPYTAKHDGVDIAAMSGTPLRSIAAGTVSYARSEEDDPNPRRHWALGGGRTVNVDIGGNRTLQYAHLQSFVVSEGQRVSVGTLLGKVGASGNAHGSHVHFGLWDHDRGAMIRPYAYLAELAGSSRRTATVARFVGPRLVDVEVFHHPRHFRIRAGRTVRAYDPHRPNRVVRQRHFPKGSGAAATKLVRITWPGMKPQPVPHGTFLLVSTGIFRGCYIVPSQVELLPPG